MSFNSPNSPNCKSVSSMPLANNYERCDINKNRFEMAIRLRASQQSSQPIKKHKSKSSITIQKLNKIIPVLPDFTKMISSIPRSYFSLSPSLNKSKYEVINNQIIEINQSIHIETLATALFPIDNEQPNCRFEEIVNLVLIFNTNAINITTSFGMNLV